MVPPQPNFASSAVEVDGGDAMMTLCLPPVMKILGGYVMSSSAGVVAEIAADSALPLELPG